MSVARGGNRLFLSNITELQQVQISFTVTATNGLGVTSVKSNGWVNNVFMHTSTTPTANGGVTNPNPAAGIAIVQLKQNFNVYLGLGYSFQAPGTGGAVTTTVANTSYIIGVLGTTTVAQWNAVGLPKGFTPAVGQAFTATASQAIGGTGSVLAVGVSAVASAEVFGLPNTMLSNSSIAANSGAYVYVQFLDFAGALIAPTAGTIVNLRLYYDRSLVTIDGL